MVHTQKYICVTLRIYTFLSDGENWSYPISLEPFRLWLVSYGDVTHIKSLWMSTLNFTSTQISKIWPNQINHTESKIEILDKSLREEMERYGRGGPLYPRFFGFEVDTWISTIQTLKTYVTRIPKLLLKFNTWKK